MEILQFEFMRNALMAGLLASIICGIMGTLVVVNRIVFLSGGIAHAAYGGIGLGFYFGLPYLPSTLGFSLVVSILMAVVTMKAKHRADTIIGVIWAVGMALGIILIDLTPGYNVDLMSYLFGSILTVPKSDLFMMLAMAIIITGLSLFYYKDILAMSYDEEFAKIRGVPVKVIYIALISLLAITVVVVIQVVGLILIIALLTIPPFIVERYARSLGSMMIWSSFAGMLFTVCGLWISYVFDVTSGAAIIMVAGSVFFISLMLDQVVLLYRKRSKVI
ncbi:MAG: metal ABC transporter permease [Desulfamplus sp.]|nr:metal ABC transporter permease [Desulfamplus sp.]